ncbi:MAG: hypothetical protein SFX72_05860 [Isosphaeraceae bacterium]|nr:hypothetical protein [Isosphaeraceae bacterium]
MNPSPPQGLPSASQFFASRPPVQSSLAFAAVAYCLGQSGCSLTAGPWTEVRSMARTAGCWAACLGLPLALFAAAIAWKLAGRVTRFRLGPFEFDCAPAEKPTPAKPATPTASTATTSTATAATATPPTPAANASPATSATA